VFDYSRRGGIMAACKEGIHEEANVKSLVCGNSCLLRSVMRHNRKLLPQVSIGQRKCFGLTAATFRMSLA